MLREISEGIEGYKKKVRAKKKEIKDAEKEYDNWNGDNEEVENHLLDTILSLKSELEKIENGDD